MFPTRDPAVAIEQICRCMMVMPPTEAESHFDLVQKLKLLNERRRVVKLVKPGGRVSFMLADEDLGIGQYFGGKLPDNFKDEAHVEVRENKQARELCDLLDELVGLESVQALPEPQRVGLGSMVRQVRRWTDLESALPLALAPLAADLESATSLEDASIEETLDRVRGILGQTRLLYQAVSIPGSIFATVDLASLLIGTGVSGELAKSRPYSAMLATIRRYVDLMTAEGSLFGLEDILRDVTCEHESGVEDLFDSLEERWSNAIEESLKAADIASFQIRLRTAFHYAYQLFLLSRLRLEHTRVGSPESDSAETLARRANNYEEQAVRAWTSIATYLIDVATDGAEYRAWASRLHKLMERGNRQEFRAAVESLVEEQYFFPRAGVHELLVAKAAHDHGLSVEVKMT